MHILRFYFTLFGRIIPQKVPCHLESPDISKTTKRNIHDKANRNTEGAADISLLKLHTIKICKNWMKIEDKSVLKHCILCKPFKLQKV